MSRRWRVLGGFFVLTALVAFALGFLVGMGYYRDDYYAAVRWGRGLESKLDECQYLAEGSRETVLRMASEKGDLQLEISALHVDLRRAKEALAQPAAER